MTLWSYDRLVRSVPNPQDVVAGMYDRARTRSYREIVATFAEQTAEAFTKA
jgi:hypothetical protein